MAKQVEKLHYRDMSKVDGWGTTGAKKLLERFMYANGTKLTTRRAVISLF